MQEAGTVLHVARSGRLIVRASSVIRDGTQLVDAEGGRTGRVMETIGPVKAPYLSVQPSTDRIERLIGSKLYVSDAPYEGARERGRGRRFPPSSSKRFRGDKRTNQKRYPRPPQGKLGKKK